MAKREDIRRERDADEYITKLVHVNRVTKVVKGGRTMRFAALLLVGDGKGRVGVGIGKAAEIPEAINKATQAAKRAMIKAPIVGTTIPHEIVGTFGRGSVLLMPAEEGTGVIAGGPVRAVLEVAGIKDIRTKSLGSSNPINCVKATIEALKGLRTVEEVASLRGKSIEDVQA